MADMPITGVGADFRVWDGSSWQSVEQVTNVDFSGIERETYDVTSFKFAKDNNKYRNMIPGLRDGGTLELETNFTNTSGKEFKGYFDSDDSRYYELLLDDTHSTSISFKGFVVGYPMGFPLDDKSGMNVSIRIVGEIKFQDGSVTNPTI